MKQPTPIFPKNKARILIIDDEPSFTRLAKRKLEETGLFDVREENDGSRGAATAQAFKPHLILIDVIMPAVDGNRVAMMIRANPALKGISIIFLTALVSAEAVTASQGVIDGEFVVAKPVSMPELLSRISRCLAECPPATLRSKKRILVVDDEEGFTRLLKLNVEAAGAYEVIEENVGTRALATARQCRPDLILVDVIMPNISGTELIAQLEADESLQDTPVILLSAMVSKEMVEAHQGILEGYPCIAKPMSLQELLERIERYVHIPASLSPRRRGGRATGSSSG